MLANEECRAFGLHFLFASTRRLACFGQIGFQFLRIMELRVRDLVDHRLERLLLAHARFDDDEPLAVMAEPLRSTQWNVRNGRIVAVMNRQRRSVLQCLRVVVEMLNWVFQLVGELGKRLSVRLGHVEDGFQLEMPVEAPFHAAVRVSLGHALRRAVRFQDGVAVLVELILHDGFAHGRPNHDVGVLALLDEATHLAPSVRGADDLRRRVLHDDEKQVVRRIPMKILLATAMKVAHLGQVRFESVGVAEGIDQVPNSFLELFPLLLLRFEIGALLFLREGVRLCHSYLAPISRERFLAFSRWNVRFGAAIVAAFALP